MYQHDSKQLLFSHDDDDDHDNNDHEHDGGGGGGAAADGGGGGGGDGDALARRGDTGLSIMCYGDGGDDAAHLCNMLGILCLVR